MVNFSEYSTHMASMQGKIPITDWNSTVHSTRSTDESFDDGGFEEYWEKMEVGCVSMHL